MTQCCPASGINTEFSSFLACWYPVMWTAVCLQYNESHRVQHGKKKSCSRNACLRLAFLKSPQLDSPQNNNIYNKHQRSHFLSRETKALTI